ncbi:MAG: PEP-CTERM sorting domain-containing protein [Chthoniobacterales bacterium]
MKKSIISLLAAVLACTSAHAVVLSQNVDPTTILAGNSVACGGGGTTTANTWFRSFSFANFGVNGDFSLQSATFGIEQVTGTVPITVSIYAGTSVTSLGTLIASSTFNLTAAQNNTFFTLTLSGTVPFASGGLVMSVGAPDGSANGTAFYIGSNAGGQTGPGYILAPACGINAPTDIAAIGFPNDHILMSVTGTVVPEPSTYAMMGVGGILACAMVLRKRARG